MSIIQKTEKLMGSITALKNELITEIKNVGLNVPEGVLLKDIPSLIKNLSAVGGGLVVYTTQPPTAAMSRVLWIPTKGDFDDLPTTTQYAIQVTGASNERFNGLYTRIEGHERLVFTNGDTFLYEGEAELQNTKFSSLYILSYSEPLKTDGYNSGYNTDISYYSRNPVGLWASFDINDNPPESVLLLPAYSVTSNEGTVNGEYFEIDNPWTT
jgi:hypothetical protein